MHRIPAGKKALRESMQRNRQPFAVKPIDNETDEHTSDVKIPEPGPSPNDSKEDLSAPSKTPLTEKQLNQLKGVDTPRWRCYSPGDNRNFMQKNGCLCLCIKLHEKHFEAIIGFC